MFGADKVVTKKSDMFSVLGKKDIAWTRGEKQYFR